jgi:hypothetical protein
LQAKDIILALNVSQNILTKLKQFLKNITKLFSNLEIKVPVIVSAGKLELE